jgi:N-formylglutamate amidohydrolase
MLNNVSLFSEEIKNSFIFHIPHSSYMIPDENYINKELIDIELLYSTDIDVDKIFNVDGIDRYICDFSRSFCDVERFLDAEQEEMTKYGRGVYYTKTYDGKSFRKYDEKFEQTIIKNYYLKYHNNLSKLIQNKINDNGIARIIDCHSFNQHKLYFEKDVNRPDICLGVDEKYTPQYLIDFIKLGFERHGLNVEINKPYSGSFYPLDVEGKFETIMIEINKKLYMVDDKIVDTKNVVKLNKIINNIFTF